LDENATDSGIETRKPLDISHLKNRVRRGRMWSGSADITSLDVRTKALRVEQQARPDCGVSCENT